MAEKKTRISVTLKDFLRVTVKERTEFETPEAAATELGFTSIDSFKQRLTKMRKRYPAIFSTVDKYTASNGPRIADEAEALALLASLDESDSGTE